MSTWDNSLQMRWGYVYYQARNISKDMPCTRPTQKTLHASSSPKGYEKGHHRQVGIPVAGQKRRGIYLWAKCAWHLSGKRLLLLQCPLH